MKAILIPHILIMTVGYTSKMLLQINKYSTRTDTADNMEIEEKCCKLFS
jgi:hypothetical protein